MELSAEFLFACSDASLGDFELARLNRTANLRKQVKAIEEELVKLEAESMIAHWVREHRSELIELGSTHPLQKTLDFVDASGVQHRRTVLDPVQHRSADAD